VTAVFAVVGKKILCFAQNDMFEKRRSVFACVLIVDVAVLVSYSKRVNAHTIGFHFIKRCLPAFLKAIQTKKLFSKNCMIFIRFGVLLVKEVVLINVDRIISEYSDMMYRIALHNMKNHADAEDIVHDVLIKLLEKSPSFESNEHEKAWFIRVTLNTCKNVFRSRLRRQTVDIDTCRNLSGEEPSTLLQDVLSLPPDDSTIIYLYYYEGYSIREMAKILEQRESAVQSRLYRARKRLKHDLSMN